MKGTLEETKKKLGVFQSFSVLFIYFGIFSVFLWISLLWSFVKIFILFLSVLKFFSGFMALLLWPHLQNLHSFSCLFISQWIRASCVWLYMESLPIWLFIWQIFWGKEIRLLLLIQAIGKVLYTSSLSLVVSWVMLIWGGIGPLWSSNF